MFHDKTSQSNSSLGQKCSLFLAHRKCPPLSERPAVASWSVPCMFFIFYRKAFPKLFCSFFTLLPTAEGGHMFLLDTNPSRQNLSDGLHYSSNTAQWKRKYEFIWMVRTGMYNETHNSGYITRRLNICITHLFIIAPSRTAFHFTFALANIQTNQQLLDKKNIL